MAENTVKKMREGWGRGHFAKIDAFCNVHASSSEKQSPKNACLKQHVFGSAKEVGPEREKKTREDTQGEKKRHEKTPRERKKDTRRPPEREKKTREMKFSLKAQGS